MAAGVSDHVWSLEEIAGLGHLMPLAYHPAPGTVLLCDFNTGFVAPEMVKRRPVVVLSPQIQGRARLCTVVPISTQVPVQIMPFHYEILNFNPALPHPWDQGPNWVKGDMVCAVSFDRLELIRMGKDNRGKRTYRMDLLPIAEMKAIRCCVLESIGLGALTKHLP